jgi:hypothetical protein
LVFPRFGHAHDAEALVKSRTKRFRGNAAGCGAAWLEADHDTEGGLAPYTAAALEDLRAATAALS